MTDVYSIGTSVRDCFMGYSFGEPRLSDDPVVWPNMPDNCMINCVYFTWAVLHEAMLVDGITPKSSQRSAIYISKWKTEPNLTLDDAVEQELDGIKGPITAIVDQGLGVEVDVSDIMQGDFVQWWWKSAGSVEWNRGHSVIAAGDIVDCGGGDYDLNVLGAHYNDPLNPDSVHEKIQHLNTTDYKIFAARYTGCTNEEIAPVLPPYPGWVDPARYGDKKTNNSVKLYPDSADFMKDLAHDLRRAKDTIFMTDWWMEQDVHLIRNGLSLKA